VAVGTVGSAVYVGMGVSKTMRGIGIFPEHETAKINKERRRRLKKLGIEGEFLWKVASGGWQVTKGE